MAAQGAAQLKLADLARGRDNNFNLIRICAAFAVLVSHSFALSAGTSQADPMLGLVGLPLGVFAVDAFFVASGFLVTASIVTRQDAMSFVRARFLRVFPGLWVMLLLTVFGLGVAFTTMPLSGYLRSERVYFYLLKGGTLVTGVSHDLPGVFEQVPYRSTVNGSLWTLPYEIRMYLLLLAGWTAWRALAGRRPQLLRSGVVAVVLLTGAIMFARHFHDGGESHFARLCFMFFSGSACLLFNERVDLRRGAFWAITVTLIASAVLHAELFFVVYNLSIAYLVLYLAYVPRGRIRSYNRVGDYSYGVYIYAFPIQQAICTIFPGISALSLLVLSGCLTLICAALSWHCVEKPCLALKPAAGT